MKEAPQYRKVYMQLRKHILSGAYIAGDILPSENELCVVNKVTRPTVRKALDILTNDGLIKKHQGLGSVVQNIRKGIGILSISGTTSAIGSESLKTSIVVKPQVQQWPESFPFELTEIEKESGCIYLERLRLLDDQPVFFDISYLPNINLPRFTSRNLKDESLFEVLKEHYNIDVRGGEQYIKAIHPEQKIMQYLEVSNEMPILNLVRKLSTNRIDYSIYSILYCNTENHSLYGQF